MPNNQETTLERYKRLYLEGLKRKLELEAENKELKVKNEILRMKKFKVKV